MNTFKDLINRYNDGKNQDILQYQNIFNMQKRHLIKEVNNFYDKFDFYPEKNIFILSCNNLVKTIKNIKTLSSIRLQELNENRLDDLGIWIYDKIDLKYEKLGLKILNRLTSIKSEYRYYDEKVKLLEKLYNLAKKYRKHEEYEILPNNNSPSSNANAKSSNANAKSSSANAKSSSVKSSSVKSSSVKSSSVKSSSVKSSSVKSSSAKSSIAKSSIAKSSSVKSSSVKSSNASAKSSSVKSSSALSTKSSSAKSLSGKSSNGKFSRYEIKKKQNISGISLSEYVYRYFRYNKENPVELLDHKAFQFIELISGSNISNEDKIALITAYCQSGKTFLIIPMTLIFLSMKYTPIMVVLDRAQVKQLMQRIKSITDGLCKHLKENIGFTDDEINIFDKVLYYDSDNPLEDENLDLNNALNGKQPRIVICIKHFVHIKRINDLMTEKSNIVLIADEAQSSAAYKHNEDEDGFYHDKRVKYEQEFVKLKDASEKCVCISATAQDLIMVEVNLWSDNIVYIPPNSDYTGIKNCKFINIDATHLQNIVDYTLGIMEQLSIVKPITRIDRRNKKTDLHPISVLAKIDRKLEEIGDFMNRLASGSISNTIKDGKWTFLTFTGKGICLFNESMKEHKLIIENQESQLLSNGVHLFESGASNSISVNDMYQFLAEQGIEKCPRILMSAYDMACEAISFISHFDKPHNYHLTHAILNLSDSVTTANATQTTCRVLGNHADDIEPVIYISQKAKEKVIKGFELHDKQIKELISISQLGNQNVKCVEYLKGIEVMSNRVPPKFTKQSIKGEINKVENPNRKKEEEVLRLSEIKGIKYLSFIEPEKYGSIKEQMKEDGLYESDDEEEEISDDDKIDGVSVNRLHKWFSKNNETLVGTMIKFLYSENKPVTFQEFRDGITYRGSDSQFSNNIDGGRSINAAYGFLWSPSSNFRTIKINPNIKAYLDTLL